MSNKTINLGSRMQGSKPFLEIQAVNQDNFQFDANSTLNLADSLTVQNLTLNGDFINNGGGSVGGASAEYSTSVTTPKLIFNDNLSEGLIIESTDGADYIVCNSTNGSEQINLKKKIFTDGNQLVCGTNGSRGILQYANIKNSTIDNTNTVSANTTGTASAWASNMTLNLANPYTGSLASSVAFNGSSTSQLDLKYINEGSSAVHTFYMKNINSGHDSEYLQQRISFINPYSGTLNDYDLDNEIISQRDNLTFRLYNSYQTDYSCDLNLSPSIQNDMPSFNNFLYFSSGVSAGTRYMNILNTNTTYDTTTGERQNKTGIKLGNSGFYGSTNGTGDTFAEIMGNWRDAGIGQLRLTAIQGVSSTAQECGLLITDNSGTNAIQQKQNANNMIISGQQIDGISDIKYLNGCAVGNSNHLGWGMVYKDSGGSVISGASTGYDNTLELKLKSGGGLDVDANGLFVSDGASSDEITDADGSSKITVETNDIINFKTNSANRMRIDADGRLSVNNIYSLAYTTITTEDGNPPTALSDIQDYLLLLGGGAQSSNPSVVSYGLGFGAVNVNTDQPPAYIKYDETDINGDSKGRLVFGARSTTTGTDTLDTMFINDGKVGVGINNPKGLFNTNNILSSSDNTIRPSNSGNTNYPAESLWLGKSTTSTSNYWGMSLGTIYNGGSYIQALNTNTSTYYDLYLNPNGGNVGIGTNNPKGALHVVGGPSNTFYPPNAWGHYYLSASGLASSWPGMGGTTNGFPVATGIISESAVMASVYHTFSDRRIKTDIDDVPDNLALEQVNNLQCKYYNYKDYSRTREHKVIGFIAQEVAEIIPNAVSLRTDFIPDEMRIIENPVWEPCETGFKLILDLDLSENHTGNCRFYLSDDVEGKEECIKEVKYENGGFVFDKQYLNVFFWGKEVNDFHTIDKNMIFSLHHSAIQELDKKNDLLENRCALLETENNSLLERTQVLEDTLSSQNTELENKVNSLETLLADLSRRVAINETTLHGLIQ